MCIKNFSSWNEEFKFGFISGLIDSDGYVGSHGSGIRAFIFTSSQQLAKQINEIARSLNLETSIRILTSKNLWYIRIFSKSLRNKGLNSIKLRSKLKRSTK